MGSVLYFGGFYTTYVFGQKMDDETNGKTFGLSGGAEERSELVFY